MEPVGISKRAYRESGNQWVRIETSNGPAKVTMMKQYAMTIGNLHGTYIIYRKGEKASKNKRVHMQTSI
jgi:hypothetical protein